MKEKDCADGKDTIMKGRPKASALMAFEDSIPNGEYCEKFILASDEELLSWLNMPFPSNKAMIASMLENKKVLPNSWDIRKCFEWVYLKSESLVEDFEIKKEAWFAANKDKVIISDEDWAQLEYLDEQYKAWSEIGLVKSTLDAELEFYLKHQEGLKRVKNIGETEDIPERIAFEDAFIAEDGLCDFCIACEENGDDEDCENCECRLCERNRLNNEEYEDDLKCTQCDCEDCCGYDCLRVGRKNDAFFKRFLMANNNELTYKAEHNAIWNGANFEKRDVKKIWYIQDITKDAMVALYNSLGEVGGIFECLSVMLHKRMQLESKVEAGSTSLNYYKWMCDKYFGKVPIANAPTLPMLFNTMVELLAEMETTLYADGEKKVLAKVLRGYTGQEELEDKRSFNALKIAGYSTYNDLNFYGTEERYIPLSYAKKDCDCCEDCGSWTQRDIEECDCQLYEENYGKDIDEDELKETGDANMQELSYWFLLKE